MGPHPYVKSYKQLISTKREELFFPRNEFLIDFPITSDYSGKYTHTSNKEQTQQIVFLCLFPYM